MQLSHDGRIKLADVGVAKHEKDITGTICGTSLYLSPEVSEGRIYNSKADMYSFGFVLWELWYGQTAFHDMVVSRSQSVLLADVRRGLRPSHIEGTYQPWRAWKEVMESCWQIDPRKRITAEVGWELLKQLHKEVVRCPKVPPPPPPRPKSIAVEQPTKPKPLPRPRLKSTGASVSFCSKTEDASVHLESKEKE